MSAERRITQQTERILQALTSDPTAEWSGSQIAPIAGLKSGTLYPALLRMEKYGWLTWKWEEIDPTQEGRPRRRLYTLTGTGEQAAEEIANEATRRQRLRERRQHWHPRPGGSPA